MTVEQKEVPMTDAVPATTARVPHSTAEEVNRRIYDDIRARVNAYAAEGPEAIERRLRELDHEWDIERMLEANAAAISLIGVGLGSFIHRRWHALPALVGVFLLQHAIQGWCPPVPLFRRYGFRTETEIGYERYALKALRGDFQALCDSGPVTSDAALVAVTR
jgi:hypothetical protein